MSTHALALSLTPATFAVLLLLCGQAFAADGGGRTIITGGMVYDGTGAPGVAADVLIEGGKIVKVAPGIEADGATVIDATGHVVCPGFIDVHNHTHGWQGAPDDATARQVPSSITQGVTTIVVGMDGGGEVDIAKYAAKIRANPRSVNIARLVGHSAVRAAVLVSDDDRPRKERTKLFERKSTPEEMSRMAAIVEKAMTDGAFGLSSGLEYLGDYVTTEEVIAMAKAVAPYGGYYETHLRNEDVGVFEATEEAIRICREAGNIPLSISHIKVSFAPMLGKAGELLAIMEAARADGITVYSNWRSSIQWASNLTSFDEDKKQDLEAIGAEIVKYWPKADAYLFECSSHPELVGKTLDKIAASWEVTPAEALVRIWGFGDARFEFNAMIWKDKLAFLLDEFCMVSSDGADGLRQKGRRDPMIWSCFPIFFDRMVRDWKWVSMEAAVYKCTGLPAEMLGLEDRGLLKAGMAADIVVFDPKTISGEEHWDKFDTPPVGISHVLVNGITVLDGGGHTGKHPGLFLAKPRAK